MLILITILLCIILFSRITEEHIKIPATLGIIVSAYLVSFFFPSLFSVNHEDFHDILYLMLPMILLPDILNIATKELRSYAKEIFYLAVVSVLISIALAVVLTPYLLGAYNFTLGMLLALFTMLMATDAITVGSLMRQFRLPQRLKIYAESESLFNDVTALILFYFVALPLLEGVEVDLLAINFTIFKVVVLSTLIGVLSGYFGYFLMKLLHNPFDQFIVIYLTVMLSFLCAEYFHIAGILSVVASVIMFKLLIQKESAISHHPLHLLQAQRGIYKKIFELIKNIPTLSKHEFREYKKEAMYVGVFANSVVFVVIAYMVNLDTLLAYRYEIMSIFFLTTLIRFGGIATLIVAMRLPMYWATSLTLSGAKGALAIIMVNSLPQSFIYQELFSAIVIGNVLISTFVYTFILMWHIKRHNKEYESDLQKEEELDEQSESHLSQEIVKALQEEIFSHAYNRAFMEEILEKELVRLQRYKVDLSAIVLRLDFKKNSFDVSQSIAKVGDTIAHCIRRNDYFGKLHEDSFIILATNTSLSGALTLTNKITKEFERELAGEVDFHFGLTQAHETDDVAMVIEKLEDALIKSKQSHQNLEIEM